MQFTRYAGAALLLSAALGLAVPAHADFTSLTSASQLQGSDITLDFSGADGAVVPSPIIETASGNTLTFTASGKEVTLTRIDSDGAAFDFADGTPLIETTAGGFYPDGPLTLTFAKGVTEFGFSAQDFAPDIELFVVQVYNGTKPLGFFFVGPADNTSDLGTSIFLGGKTTKGDVVTRLVIYSLSSEGGAGNDFFVGPTTFATASAAASK